MGIVHGPCLMAASQSGNGDMIIVVIVIAVLALWWHGNQRVRCPRCTFQFKRKELTGGRCPKCGSQEF